MERVLFKKCSSEQEASERLEGLGWEHSEQHEAEKTQEGRRQSGDNVKPRDLYALIQSQGFLCALTGKPLEPSYSNVDHKQPLARGGSHSIENIQIIHQTVNRMKHTMTQEEFIEMCCAVADWTRGVSVAPSGAKTP